MIFQLYGKPGSRENSNSVNVLKKSGVSGDSCQYGDVGVKEKPWLVP